MNIKEYESIKNLSYSELCNYLKHKYGDVPGNYFNQHSDGSLSVNNKIKRGKEGLQCHHIKENEVPSLSDKSVAESNEYSFQEAQNLCYCNLIEHLLLHVLIAIETCENKLHDTNVKLGVGGVRYIATHINTILSRHEFKPNTDEIENIELDRNANYDLDGIITNNKDTYHEIANRFCTNVFIRQCEGTPEDIAIKHFTHKFKNSPRNSEIEEEVYNEAKHNKLFDWNVNCYAELESYLKTNRTALVQICTGGGKTTTALEYLRVHEGTAIILGPKDVVGGAWQPTRNENDQVIDKETRNNNKELTNRTKYYNYATFMNRYKEMIDNRSKDCNIIICDEAHHLRENAARWKEGIDYVLQNTDMKIIGLTATPDIAQLNGTDNIFEGRICNGLDLAQGILNNDIHPFSYVQSIYEYTDIKNELTKDETVYGNELWNKLNLQLNANPIEKVLKDNMPGGIRKMIVFVSKIASDDPTDCTEAMAMECMKKFDPRFASEDFMRAIDSKRDQKYNSDAIQWFNETNDHDVCLINVGMVSEGAHYKGINTLIMFRRTDSSTLYLQQLGRIVVTKLKENPHGIVFDFTNNASHIVGLKYYNSEADDEHPPIEQQIIDAIKEKIKQIAGSELIYRDYTEDCVSVLMALREHKNGKSLVEKFARPLLDIFNDQELEFFLNAKSTIDNDNTNKKKKELKPVLGITKTNDDNFETTEEKQDKTPSNKKKASKLEILYKTTILIFKRLYNFKCLEFPDFGTAKINDEEQFTHTIKGAGFANFNDDVLIQYIDKIRAIILNPKNGSIIHRIVNDIPPTTSSPEDPTTT